MDHSSGYEKRAQTLLENAIVSSDLKFAEFLLKSGVNLIDFDLFGDSCLILNAPSHAQKKSLQLLIKYGLSLKNSPESKLNLIAKAICLAEKGWIHDIQGITEVLLESGVPVNGSSRSSLQSPLHVAAAFENLELISYLIENGADVNARDEVGHTPLTVAVFANNISNVKLLLSHGSVIDHEMGYGLTILHAACQGLPDLFNEESVHSNGFDMVLCLIENGANVNAKCKIGWSPLHCAGAYNRVDVLELLLANGAEVDARTPSGATALHLASYFNHEAVIRCLAEDGADLNLVDIAGDTPLSVLFSYLSKENRNQFDVPAVRFMVKVIAKRKFGHLYVTEKDMDLISRHSEVKSFYDSCVSELGEMSKAKFHSSHTYYSFFVAANLKNLAKLIRNKELVVKFEIGLSNFPRYEHELRIVLEKATRERDELTILYSKLKLVFKYHLPDVVIRILADNLNLEDLPY